MLSIHENIHTRLNSFIDGNKIPNLIFHGQYGGGKRYIANEFISKIYNNNKTLIDTYVMWVNCAHGKGIRFVREELKFFAKTNINNNCGYNFKIVVLENADFLTIDAQSALRRCIELFSHTTRFILIVENKQKLLKPILSRFCEIYVPLPIIKGTQTNLHTYNINRYFGNNKKEKISAVNWFKKKINNMQKPEYRELMNIASQAYEHGYSGLDILDYINDCNLLNNLERSKQLFICHRIKREFRNEKICMLSMLSQILIRSNCLINNVNVV